MLVDEVKISVRGGKGGNGSVTFGEHRMDNRPVGVMEAMAVLFILKQQLRLVTFPDTDMQKFSSLRMEKMVEEIHME